MQELHYGLKVNIAFGKIRFIGVMPKYIRYGRKGEG